jgi:glycosyltransferase involved in cell wall biosynthesis
VISVIIPVYNRQEFIQRSVESVLNQTLPASQIIVVDDGSSDLTPQILQLYKDKIEIITTKNQGVSRARNIGIAHSKYRWITFLDSDDEWDEKKLELQYSFHQKNPHILFSHTLERWIKNGKTIKPKKHHKKPKGWCFDENISFCKIAPSSVMVAREVLDKVGCFDESLRVCEDFDLWLRILKRYELGLIEKELVTKYAGHKDQLSTRYHSMDEQRIYALKKHIEIKGVREEIIRKYRILIEGALKRGKKERASVWKEEMSKFLL